MRQTDGAMKRFLLAITLCFVASVARAQLVRGTISDSASRRPIPGAVLLLLDADGRVLGRNISNERGEYAVARTAAMQRMRVQRIGFRPRDFTLPAFSTEDVTVNVEMPMVPAFLDPVRVTARACAGRTNQATALALLEQARAGLLTAVVAREAKPASLVLYMYERKMDGTTARIDYQRVWMDSTYRNAVSFSAVRSAEQFVRLGFMADSPTGQVFYAPDADVLLNDGFTAGYCFRVMPANKTRPNQLGLGFEAEKHFPDRVDIEGALWIDTAARALRDIEFRYVGLDRRLEVLEPGGKISFREMPNGVVLIDRWSLRLIGTAPDTIDRNPMRMVVHQKPYASESGGELAHVRWRDSVSWDNRLGTLDLLVTTRGGRRWPGLEIRLPASPYRGTTAADGRLMIRDLVPGPYVANVVDPALAPIDWRIPTDLWFMSQRDSLALALKVPTTEEYILDRCYVLRRGRFNVSDTVVALARVMTTDGRPVSNARWSTRVSREPTQWTSWGVVHQEERTGSDGLMPVCSGALRQGHTLELTVEHERLGRAAVQHVLDKRVNVFVIFLGG